MSAKLAKPVCLAVDHRFTDERVYAEHDARHSVCSRCGHKRYRPPDEEAYGHTGNALG